MSLVVVTPAASTRLTTPARARAMLGLPAGDDAALGLFIDQASAAVAAHCRRRLAIETVREAFGEPGGLLGRVVLSRVPVAAIVGVSLDGITLSAAGFALDPSTGHLWPAASPGWSAPVWSGLSLAVEYRGGFVLPSDAPEAPTLPPDVERAAILMVGTYLSARARDPLVKAETVEGIGSTSWWVPGAADALPHPEAAQLLQPYVRFA